MPRSFYAAAEKGLPGIQDVLKMYLAMQLQEKKDQERKDEWWKRFEAETDVSQRSRLMEELRGIQETHAGMGLPPLEEGYQAPGMEAPGDEREALLKQISEAVRANKEKEIAGESTKRLQAYKDAAIALGISPAGIETSIPGVRPPTVGTEIKTYQEAIAKGVREGGKEKGEGPKFTTGNIQTWLKMLIDNPDMGWKTNPEISGEKIPIRSTEQQSQIDYLHELLNTIYGYKKPIEYYKKKLPEKPIDEAIARELGIVDLYDFNKSVTLPETKALPSWFTQ